MSTTTYTDRPEAERTYRSFLTHSPAVFIAFPDQLYKQPRIRGNSLQFYFNEDLFLEAGAMTTLMLPYYEIRFQLAPNRIHEPVPSPKIFRNRIDLYIPSIEQRHYGEWKGYITNNSDRAVLFTRGASMFSLPLQEPGLYNLVCLQAPRPRDVIGHDEVDLSTGHYAIESSDDDNDDDMDDAVVPVRWMDADNDDDSNGEDGPLDLSRTPAPTST